VHPLDFFAPTALKLWTIYTFLLAPAVSVLGGWLLLTVFVQRENADYIHGRKIRDCEIVVLLSFVAIPLFEYVASKLTGAPFLARYSLSTVAGFAGLLGVTLRRKPAASIGTLALLIGQVGFSFFGFATGSVLIEPSSGYKISTRIQEFRERYVWMDENKTLPILVIEDLDAFPTVFYAPADVKSRIVYAKWVALDVLGDGITLLNACCSTGPTPAVTDLAPFLVSHRDFLAFGSSDSGYRLLLLSKDQATVSVKNRSADHVLALVSKSGGYK